MDKENNKDSLNIKYLLKRFITSIREYIYFKEVIRIKKLALVDLKYRGIDSNTNNKKDIITDININNNITKLEDDSKTFNENIEKDA